MDTTMSSLYKLKVKEKEPLRRRSRIEVVMDILDGAIEPARITHIMSKDVANIDYANARAFLTYLKAQGLIDYIQMAGETFYKTSDEGRRVSRAYRKITKRVGVWG